MGPSWKPLVAKFPSRTRTSRRSSQEPWKPCRLPGAAHGRPWRSQPLVGTEHHRRPARSVGESSPITGNAVAHRLGLDLVDRQHVARPAARRYHGSGTNVELADLGHAVRRVRPSPLYGSARRAVEFTALSVREQAVPGGALPGWCRSAQKSRRRQQWHHLTRRRSRRH